jgi:hypothetical protein
MMVTYIFYAIVTLWLIIVTFFLVRLTLHYTRLTADVSKKDLVSALNHFISVSNQNSDSIQQLASKLENEIVENKKHTQNIGFKRYNPFTDTGGDQSFTAVFLDDNGDGIMIGSLHSRENTRLYAKKVESGVVQNSAISSEEKEVIKQALK